MGRREAREEYKSARKALEENGRRQRATGNRDETESFRQANQRVADAEKNVSWWRRR